MLKTNLPAWLAVGAASVLASGCIIVADVDAAGFELWGEWTERERDVHQDITKIDYDAKGTLYLVQGDGENLRLEGNESALEAIRVEEHGDTLRISQANPSTNQWWNRGDHDANEILYYLEIPYLEEIRHSGHGEIKVGPLTVESLIVASVDNADTKLASVNARRFELTVRDHANVNLETLDVDEATLVVDSHADIYAHDVDALDLDIRVEDYGNFWSAGRADAASLIVRDHAVVDGSRLQCEVVSVTASDHSEVEIWAESTLRLAKQDHAEISWTGSPQVEETTALSSN